MTRFRRATAATVLALNLAAPALACMPPPYSEDYRKHQAETYSGPQKEVDFSSHPVGASLSDEQKAKIRASVALGANFAGAYRLVQFRCGDTCVHILVVSLATGKIHRVPVEGAHMADYRQHSKFLVVRALDESRRVSLFVFEGGEFRPTQADQS